MWSAWIPSSFGGNCGEDLLGHHFRTLQRHEVADAIDEAQHHPAEEVIEAVRPLSREKRVELGPQDDGRGAEPVTGGRYCLGLGLGAQSASGAVSVDRCGE